jgi:large subunit ribosomal protein L21e
MGLKMSRGFRRKTRKLLTKKDNSGFSDKLLTLGKLESGDKVVIILNPTFHKGMPHKRYHGHIGTIIKKRGRAYEVEVSKGDKKVLLVVPPEHLKPFQKVS